MNERNALINTVKRINRMAEESAYSSEKVEALVMLRDILFDILGISDIESDAEIINEPEDPRR